MVRSEDMTYYYYLLWFIWYMIHMNHMTNDLSSFQKMNRHGHDDADVSQPQKIVILESTQITPNKQKRQTIELTTEWLENGYNSWRCCLIGRPASPPEFIRKPQSFQVKYGDHPRTPNHMVRYIFIIWWYGKVWMLHFGCKGPQKTNNSNNTWPLQILLVINTLYLGQL